MTHSDLEKIQAYIKRSEPKIDQLSPAESRRLGNAYVTIALSQADGGRLDLALSTIEGALGLVPECTELIDALAEIHARYATLYKEVAKRQRTSQRPL